MKKSLLITSFLFISTLLFAQEKLTGSYTELYVGADWTPYDSTVTKVDLFNRIEEKIIKKYRNGSWETSIREQYTYSTNGQPESIVYSDFNAGTWTKKSAGFYTYNSTKGIQTEQMAKWSSGTWQDTMVREYYYNTSLYPDSSILYYIDMNGDKHQSLKTVYGYDNNGRLMNSLNQLLSSAGWVDSESFSYLYDVDNKLKGILREGILNGTSTKLDSTLYQYTELGNIKKIERKNLQANVPVERTVFQYSILVSPGGIKEMHRETANTFPNPFNDKLTILFDQAAGEQFSFSLYDASGHQVRSASEVKAGRIDLEKGELKRGLYFYKIQGYDRLISGQVIAD